MRKEAVFSDARLAAVAVGRRLLVDWLVPATSGHTIDQEIATPMTGFKVQPPLVAERESNHSGLDNRIEAPETLVL